MLVSLFREQCSPLPKALGLRSNQGRVQQSTTTTAELALAYCTGLNNTPSFAVDTDHMGLACQVQTFSGSTATHSSHRRFDASTSFDGSASLHQHCCRPFSCRRAPQTFRSGPFRPSPTHSRFARCLVRASGSGDSPQESSQTTMSPEEAYELLGVRESANFEQIMTAKKNLVNKAGNNQDRKTQV